MDKLTGSCLCGKVAFVIENPLDPMMLTCHCRDCQQITGTGHARSIGVQKDQVKWVGTGETKGYSLTSFAGNGVDTHFCDTCGTPIYKWASVLSPDVLFFHAGTLDGESINAFNHSVEIWMHSKPAWDNLCTP